MDRLNSMFRTGILATTDNAVVTRFVDRYGMKMGAARFVAGETLDEAVVVHRLLNEEGFATNTTILGEHVTDAEAAAAYTDENIEVLERIASEGLDTHLAIKLTQLGLNIREDLALSNARQIVERARSLGNFVRIDMEESAWVDSTLRIYKALRGDGLDNVGAVLQSYLYRTEKDFRDLVDISPNLRIVKGAYLEPAHIAYPRKEDVDLSYLRLVKRSLSFGGYTAVATHDERIIQHVMVYTDHNDIGNDQFEFQMLYGIAEELQHELLAEGYKVRIATPFGPDWYPYLMRRMAERPANLLFVAKNLR